MIINRPREHNNYFWTINNRPYNCVTKTIANRPHKLQNFLSGALPDAAGIIQNHKLFAFRTSRVGEGFHAFPLLP